MKCKCLNSISEHRSRVSWTLSSVALRCEVLLKLEDVVLQHTQNESKSRRRRRRRLQLRSKFRGNESRTVKRKLGSCSPNASPLRVRYPTIGSTSIWLPCSRSTWIEGLKLAGNLLFNVS